MQCLDTFYGKLILRYKFAGNDSRLVDNHLTFLKRVYSPLSYATMQLNTHIHLYLPMYYSALVCCRQRIIKIYQSDYNELLTFIMHNRSRLEL